MKTSTGPPATHSPEPPDPTNAKLPGEFRGGNWLWAIVLFGAAILFAASLMQK
jgi:hypothetical protein